MQFVHLHTHSEYSLLDGANRIDDLIDRAVELGMPALALTDHGNLFGAWEFQAKAWKKGIKPIIGCELYVAYGDRRSRERVKGAPANYAHLVLLAENATGYSNLIKLSSIGYTEGFYRRPRVDREVMEEYAEGLVCLSACLAGEVARYLQQERYDHAKQAAEWHARVFKDRYWLELQNHGIPEQEQVNAGIIQLADELGLPLVVTNDAHYMRREDADAHDTLLCIGTGKDKSDPDRLRFFGEESYFKTAEEMAELFPDLPGLLAETVTIAERCHVKLEKRTLLPSFPLPDEFEEPMEMLRHQATKGAKGRYGEELPEAVEARLNYELDVIERTGYAGYLLIVWDFIVAARERDIPVGPGRGSAAGSIICYSLGITDVDPLEFGLLFERFLNPDRVSMPDIDIDFCYERRGEVIEYVRQKYGQESVGQIITFGTMKARAVIRDVGRVLGFLPSETDRLAKLIPSNPGFPVTVSEARQSVKELKELDRTDAKVTKLLDYAERIEGLSRHSSVHAAGVVIAPGPLDDYVPVCSDTKNGADVVITQFDMNALEEAGMLKMDFLGLRTLTVIHDAVRNVEERRGVIVNWDEIGLEDPAVYEMLAGGRTSGVFQFESSLATDKLRAMRCDQFDDLVAVNALIRPGPLDSGMTDVFIERKRGFKPVEYPHPDLEEILKPTYGVITYQEQVMRIANVLAGFSLAEADVLRKAVGKKDAEKIDRVLKEFVARTVERGIEERQARSLAEQLRTFGRYGFNKCLPGDVEVLDAETGQLHRIEDLFEQRASLRRVLACDPEHLRLEKATVAEVVDNGVRPVFRLRTESGREIEATANHPFLTVDGWRSLGDLDLGAHIAVPRTVPIDGDAEWPDHEVIALGHLLAEGNLREVPKRAFRLRRRQIALLLSRMWEGDGHINRRDRSLFYATASKRLAHQVQHLLLRLDVIGRLRSVDFPYDGDSKRGYQVFITGNENLRAFAETVGQRFVSRHRRAAVESLVLEESQGPIKDLVPVQVRGRVRDLKAAQGLTWNQIESGAGVSSRDFYPTGTNPQKIGFRRRTVRRLAEFFDDQNLARLANSDVLWDRVIEVEFVGEKRTYDLEVPGPHNFVANDIIVHNSHSVAYSVLSYRTAWLKAHYAPEFMAALLSSEIGSTDAVVSYIGASRALGIRVLPPSVIESGYRFTVVDDPDQADKSAIRFGLGAIKGVGHSAIQSILAANAETTLESFLDFLERIDLRLNNSRVIQALIGAGALDDLGDRAALAAGLDVMLNEAQLRRQEAESGQTSLFGGPETDGARPVLDLPTVPPWSERDRLREEKARLGFYISGHPLARYRDLVDLYALDATTTKLQDLRDRTVEVPCVITEVSVRTARRDGREWARLTIEDFHGTATVLVFGDTWLENRELLTDDRPVLVTGTVSGNSRDDDDPPIFLDSVRPLADVRDQGQVGILIELREGDALEPGAFERARELLEASPGRGPVYLEWRECPNGGNGSTARGNGGSPEEPGEQAPRFASRTLRVAPNAALIEELRALLGERVKLVRNR